MTEGEKDGSRSHGGTEKGLLLGKNHREDSTGLEGDAASWNPRKKLT